MSRYENGFYHHDTGILLPETYETNTHFDDSVLIKTPAMITYLREHFNCPNLTRAIMKNQRFGADSAFPILL